MLSHEFIPTSSSDEEFIKANAEKTAKAKAELANSTVASVIAKPVSFTTNPEGIKFVPQPPVQFYYSLQVRQL